MLSSLHCVAACIRWGGICLFDREVREDSASCPKTLPACSTDAFQTPGEIQQGCSAPCHDYDFSSEVTCSMFALAVSHSQLDQAQAATQTDPTSSNFGKVVKTCQLPAACRPPTLVARPLHMQPETHVPRWEGTEMLPTCTVTSYLQKARCAFIPHILISRTPFIHTETAWGSCFSNLLRLLWKVVIVSDLVDIFEGFIRMFHRHKKAQNATRKSFKCESGGFLKISIYPCCSMKTMYLQNASFWWVKKNLFSCAFFRQSNWAFNAAYSS